ncbi:MAG: VanZ family protein, partial [Pseudonocardiaceae bacterium]
MWGPIVPFGGAALLSMAVLFAPGTQTPEGPWWADDVVHIALFALLASTGRRLPVRRWVLLAGLVGYAGLS